uniref:Uncharacterized protein n=1 Tax=Romanomermis culicivorax TaxID=13658 RepID=A0A915JHP0_ROMCU
MLEPETQETFIDPSPRAQQEIDQIPGEAKKEVELFSLELIKKQQRLDPKLMDIFKKIAENSSKNLDFTLESLDPTAPNSNDNIFVASTTSSLLLAKQKR